MCIARRICDLPSIRHKSGMNAYRNWTMNKKQTKSVCVPFIRINASFLPSFLLLLLQHCYWWLVLLLLFIICPSSRFHHLSNGFPNIKMKSCWDISFTTKNLYFDDVEGVKKEKDWLPEIRKSIWQYAQWFIENTRLSYAFFCARSSRVYRLGFSYVVLKFRNVCVCQSWLI